MAQGYCVKCGEMVDMNDAKEVVTKNNRKMMKGKCGKCNTTVCKIMGKA